MKKIISFICSVGLLLGLTPHAFADSRSETQWKQAYQRLILASPRIDEWNPMHKDDLEPGQLLYSYTLYDVDKDGTPELFLHFENSVALEHGKLYTFRNGKAVELKSFAYGRNSFATDPDGQGVLFRHIYSGQYIRRWTIKGDEIEESDILFQESDFAETKLDDIVSGAVDLTEFPAYTLLPLLQYEEWEEYLNPALGDSTRLPEQASRFPKADHHFFDRVVAGEIPVIPNFVARSYQDWARFYYQEVMPKSAAPTYAEVELSFAKLAEDVYTSKDHVFELADRAVTLSDLNGDGKLEAICSATYRVDDDYTTFTILLSEQEGKVYAYALWDEPVAGVDARGTLYYNFPDKWMDFTYEGAYRLCFDGDACFQVLVPLKNYVGSASNAWGYRNAFQGASIGDRVTFGRYEQDNDVKNGPEDISWLVLTREGDKVLAVSEYALDCRPYHSKYAELTWAECDLRKWLNKDFLSAAFTGEEQRQIASASVRADMNPQYASDPGKATEDQIFLLSLPEIEQYFKAEKDRRCEATAYAAANGSKTNKELDTCWWWTRSPGCDNYYVSDVRPDGELNYVGSDADRDYLSVRPAMWVYL